ncbi:MAG: DMT family transporter [Candidatus Longimicrobiales bacterium M2_2A_002]
MAGDLRLRDQRVHDTAEVAFPRVRGASQERAPGALQAWPRADEAVLGLAGVALPLGVALGAAAETVLLKRLQVGSALLAVAGWQLLVGAILLLGVSAVTERGPIIWSTELTAALAFLALPGTAVGLGLWYWLVQREAVSRLAGFMFMVPVAGLLLAWAFFEETVTARQGVGLLLALGAIGLASGLVRGSRGRAAAPVTRPVPIGE